MYWQVWLHKNILLLLLVLFISYHYALAAITIQIPLTTPVGTTKVTKTTKNFPRDYYRSRKYGYGNMNGYSGYDDDDDDGDYNYYQKTGHDGIDPRRDGTDIGDFGPVYDNQPPMSASMDIFIRYADDWESDLQYGGKGRGGSYGGGSYGGGGDNNYGGKGRGGSYGGGDNNYGGKGRGGSYAGRDNNYGGKGRGGGYGGGDNNYGGKGRGGSYGGGDSNYGGKGRGGSYGGEKKYEKKPSYSRVKFPVRRYPDAKRFPIRRFPPLISIFPWLPIFFDRITYQTIIFSPTGGVYIIPPVINFYGQRFAVAQLIKWGYASLVSSGGPPPPGVNVAPLVQPAPVGGAVVPFDVAKGRFTGGVKTNLRNIRPRYPKKLYKREIVDSEPSAVQNYAPNSN